MSTERSCPLTNHKFICGLVPELVWFPLREAVSLLSIPFERLQGSPQRDLRPTQCFLKDDSLLRQAMSLLGASSERLPTSGQDSGKEN